MTVVCNATPLINFAAINRLDLLQAAFRQIVIPQAVYNETTVAGFPGYGSVSEYLQELITQDQKRKMQENIEELLIAGLESGEAIEVNDEWWQQKRTNLINHLHQEK